MRRLNPPGVFAYLLALAVVALDQASKLWILRVFDLPEKASVPIAGPFHLTMVWNRGVSFGLLRADVDLARWALAAFSIVVAAFLAVWARGATRRTTAVALGLVIGGALGNVIDRIRFGAVADFLDFSRLFFPWIFNVADAAITCGVALLLLDMLLQDRGPASAGTGEGAERPRDAA
jgi:signal peptidase II